MIQHKAIPASDKDVSMEEFAEGREGHDKKEISLEETSEFLHII